MARLLTAGWETGAKELNGIVSGGINYSTTYKRTGSYGLRCTGGQYSRHVFNENETELYFRVAFMCTQNNNNANTIVFYDYAANPQLALRWTEGTQMLDLTYGGTVAPIAYGGITIPMSTWVMVEGHLTIGTAGGTFVTKINGTTNFSFTGNTDPQETGSVRSIEFSADLPGVLSGDTHCIFDDVAVNDTDGSYQNSWAGLGGIFYLEPVADGDQNDWTPSAGTLNYAMVDDIPPDNATTYNQGETNGEIELYEVDDCPQYISTVNLLEVVYRAALATSGYNELTDLVKVAGTVYSGTEHVIVPITPSFTYYKGTTHYLNPNTSIAWATAEVNAMQAGVEITV